MHPSTWGYSVFVCFAVLSSASTADNCLGSTDGTTATSSGVSTWTSSGTYSVRSSCTLYATQALHGSGATNVTIIGVSEDGTITKITKSNPGPHFKVESNAMLTLKSLHLMRRTVSGETGRAIVVTQGRIVVVSCILTGVFAQASSLSMGGALLAENRSSVLLINTVIKDSSSHRGGGIYVSNSNMTMLGGQLQGNEAVPYSDGSDTFDSVGGGLSCHGARAVCTLSGVSIVDNKATNDDTTGTNERSEGGGLSCAGLALCVLDTVLIKNNKAQHGAGLSVTNSTMTMTGLHIRSNEATTGRGGGIYAKHSTVLLNNTVIKNCSSHRGGGIYVSNSNMTMLGGQLQGNEAVPYSDGSDTFDSVGGGLSCHGARAVCTLSGVSIVDNKATNDDTTGTNERSEGGGLSCAGLALCVLDTVLIKNNKAQHGAGLSVTNSTMTVSGTHIRGNEATDGGGGVYYFASRVTLDRTMVVENLAGRYGGAMACETDSDDSYSEDSCLTHSIINMTKILITGNVAHNIGGGALSLTSCCVLTARQCTFGNNTATKNSKYSGHQILLGHVSAGAMPVRLINTNIQDQTNTFFVQIDMNALNDSVPVTMPYGGSGHCSDTIELCSQAPFTGRCQNISVTHGLACGCSTGVAIQPEEHGIASVCAPHPPYITHVVPNVSSTRGNVLTKFFGKHFGSENATIKITINNVEWRSAVRKEENGSVWIEAISEPGTGGAYIVSVNVNGGESVQKQPLFGYTPPKISSVISPSLNGGLIQIIGKDFGNENENNIEVDDGGCKRPCSFSQYFPLSNETDKITCEYAVVGAKGTCRGVTVTVSGQSSNREQYCYDVDKGEITGLPVGVQKVFEANPLTYHVKLTSALILRESVTINLQATPTDSTFICKVEPQQLLFTNLTNASASKAVTVSTSGNYVDEGTNAVVYRCVIQHTVVSNDPQYEDASPRKVEIDVINDDNADLKLWTINIFNQSLYSYDVKFIGPLYTLEGGLLEHGVGVESEPAQPVTVTPVVKMVNVNQTELPHPQLVVEPSVLVFDNQTWKTIQRVSLRSIDDNVSHNLEQFQVQYVVTTDDAIFLEKALARESMCVVDVADNDEAKIVVSEKGVLTLRGGEEFEKNGITIEGLASKPLFPVIINISLPKDIECDTEFPIVVDGDEWDHVSANILFRASASAIGGHETVSIVPSSQDSKYNDPSAGVVLNIVIEETIPPLSAPENLLMRFDSTKPRLSLSWSNSTDLHDMYEVQWGHSRLFESDSTNTTRVKTASVALLPIAPLFKRLLFARVRAIAINGAKEQASSWSAPLAPWTVTTDCDYISEYLENVGNQVQQWVCKSCPVGASCVGDDVTWKEVTAKFGWWRHTRWTDHVRSNFSRCLFPPACLGAKNEEYKDQYFDFESTVDPAGMDHPEGCNDKAGYSLNCSRDSEGRCRICATCKHMFRRVPGSMQCSKCPNATDNKVLLGLGALAAVTVICLMVVQHMVDGGKRSYGDMVKVVVLNYLQLTVLIATLKVKWPPWLKTFFNIQAAVSTVGEHLLNPACELTDIENAELVYYKQIGYMFVLPVLILFTKGLWRLLACCQGRDFRYRGENMRSPSHKDASVATIVFLCYLMYPTLCSQAFALFDCTKVGDESYLSADLQETCWTGRHLTYFVSCTCPQVLLHVLGIPLLGFRFVRQRQSGRKKMHSSISMFRYGMLYSAYNEKRWYWGAVNASRKAMVAVLTTVIEDASLEIHWIILFLAVSIMGNTFAEPYRGVVGLTETEMSRIHRFDLMSLFMLLITAWSGLFFNMNAQCGLEQAPCLAMLVVTLGLNVAFMVYCVSLFKKQFVNTWLRLSTKLCRRKSLEGAVELSATHSRSEAKSLRPINSWKVDVGNATVTSGEAEPRKSVHPNPLVYRKTLVKRDHSDSTITHCPTCGKGFTLFHRKHHCRLCQSVRCNNCSIWRVDGSRACKSCYVEAEGTVPDPDENAGDHRELMIANPMHGGRLGQ